MTSDKKNISLLANIFVKRGFKNIVISPGSRNAPIIISFANNQGVSAYSIIDERSAAFFALGIALQTSQTTAIACTSGSALLNYAPAIAEAFYQKIPLLVISADRPSHLIDVGDGQTIRQENIFRNFIKKSYQLPQDLTNKKDYSEAESQINEALNNTLYPEPGPVHINIPFEEPIYGTTDIIQDGKIFLPEQKPAKVQNKQVDSLLKDWDLSKKVMIIAGQGQPDEQLNKSLSKLSKLNNTIVLTETTSNLYNGNFIDTIDNVITTIGDKAHEFAPDIVITLGNQIVSKMIKKYLRKNKPGKHYHISISGEAMDTFLSEHCTIEIDPKELFEYILPKINKSNSDYWKKWNDIRFMAEKRRNSYLQNVNYSDLKVFDFIFNSISEGMVIHLGNSTPVRYSQLFGSKPGIIYQSNRGVSGIDGQISTAVGYSQNSEKKNLLITGDLGFLYDSNGLMNKYLPKNLKIIVVNNQGGGIFRFISGPDSTPNLEKFFEAKHNWNAQHISKAFDVEYSTTDGKSNYRKDIYDFINSDNDRIQLLEIFTPNETNSEVLRKYFKYLI